MFALFAIIIQLSASVLSLTIPLTLPFPSCYFFSPRSGPVWVCADSSSRGGERHLEGPATVSWGRSEDIHRHKERNTHEDPLVPSSHVCLAITVNKNLLYSTTLGAVTALVFSMQYFTIYSFSGFLKLFGTWLNDFWQGVSMDRRQFLLTNMTQIWSLLSDVST